MPPPKTSSSDSGDRNNNNNNSSPLLRLCAVISLVTIALLILQVVTPSRVVQISSSQSIGSGGSSNNGDGSSSSSSSPRTVISVPKALLDDTKTTKQPRQKSQPPSIPRGSNKINNHNNRPATDDFLRSVFNRTSHVAWKGTEEYRSVPGTKACPAFSSGREKITSCPSEDEWIAAWIKKLKKSGKLPDPNKRWTIVDVGCNKGYTAAGFAHTLGVNNVTRQQLGFASFLHAYRENRVPPKLRLFLAGVCCDLLEGSVAAGQQQQQQPLLETSKDNIDFYLYDGLSHNANFVRRFLLESGLNKEQTLVKHAAVAEKSGTVKFPDPGFFGSEFGSIEGVSAMSVRARQVDVPMVTLDDELDKVPYIDILLTDTEGSDFRVAAGSTKHILSGNVGLYVFELHGLRSKYPRLSTFMRAIDEHYKCWFPTAARNPPQLGARKLIPFSGECFRAEFDDISGWHNVVCANKKETELIAALEELAEEESPPMVVCNQQFTPRSLADGFFSKHKEHMPVWRWALAGVPKKRYPRF